MENPRCIQEQNRSQKKEEITEQDKNDKEIDVHKF